MASEELSEYLLVPCFFLANQAFNSLSDSIPNMAFPLSAYHPTAAWFCHHPRVFWTASKQVHCIKGNSIIATIQDTKKKTNINSNKKSVERQISLGVNHQTDEKRLKESSSTNINKIHSAMVWISGSTWVVDDAENMETKMLINDSKTRENV